MPPTSIQNQKLYYDWTLVVFHLRTHSGNFCAKYLSGKNTLVIYFSGMVKRVCGQLQRISGAGMARNAHRNARFPSMWSGLDSGHQWVQFFFRLVLALRVFLRVLRFSSLHKTNVTSPNSNSTRIAEDPHENQLRLMWLPF